MENNTTQFNLPLGKGSLKLLLALFISPLAMQNAYANDVLRNQRLPANTINGNAPVYDDICYYDADRGPQVIGTDTTASTEALMQYIRDLIQTGAPKPPINRCACTQQQAEVAVSYQNNAALCQNGGGHCGDQELANRMSNGTPTGIPAHCQIWGAAGALGVYSGPASNGIIYWNNLNNEKVLVSNMFCGTLQYYINNGHNFAANGFAGHLGPFVGLEYFGVDFTDRRHFTPVPVQEQGVFLFTNSCPSAPGSTDLFAQRMTINHDTRTANTSLSDPIVVLGPPSYVGPDPSTTRVDQVSTSFEYFLHEWDYLDGLHANESIGAIAVERNTTSLGTLAARAGSVGVDHNWQTVNFGTTFSSVPVVVAQIASFVGTQAATTRIRNVTTSSFQIRLQEETANDGPGTYHAIENVHWIAVTQGTTTVNGRPIRVGMTSNSVTEAWATVTFGGSYTNPIFIAEMQTYDGHDPAALRYTNLGNTTVQVKVEEEQSANDPEVIHADEVVGYIIIGQ